MFVCVWVSIASHSVFMNVYILCVRAVHTGRHLIVSHILIMHQRDEDLMYMMFEVDQNSLDRFQEAPMFTVARISDPELFKALVCDSGITLNLLLGHRRKFTDNISQKFVDTPLSLILSSQNYLLIDVLVQLNDLFHDCCLTTADLSCTNTSSLPVELFKLRSLHRLSMSNNRLSELLLPSVIHWPNVLQLRDLIISHNSLEHIPLELFTGLSCLETLDISHNPLKSLPKEWWTMKNLVTLDVSFTHLESLSIEADPVTSQIIASAEHETLPPLVPIHGKVSTIQVEPDIATPNTDTTGCVLKHFNASYCRLKLFPRLLALFFPNLSTLDLSHNKLQSCCAINELPTSLIKLDISNNLLQNAVKSEVFYYSAHLSMKSGCMRHKYLCNLHTLTLANNADLKHVRISDESKIGDSHVFFPKLMRFDISNCGLLQSPCNLAKLQELTHLNLSHNMDLTIPLEVCGLDNLVDFDYKGISDPITNELNMFSRTLDKRFYLHDVQ